MTFLYLLLLVTQSFALKHTFPKTFGGKTDFSDRGWRALIGHLSPEVNFGLPPTTEVILDHQPTCSKQRSKCSTTYFEKHVALKQPDSAKLWVKWHQDATPFACDSVGGCTITSVRSIADLTSQSKGWSIKASVDKAGVNNQRPAANSRAKALSLQYSKAPISPKTMASTKTLSSRCSQHHMCYIQTGTLMMTITGLCESKPVILCDRPYFACEELNYPEANMCSQWDRFTLRSCKRGISTPDTEQCSMNVAVSDDNGEPISFQVFEQKPMPVRRSIRKRDDDLTESPFGELPDGSSGTWMAWSPEGQKMLEEPPI